LESVADGELSGASKSLAQSSGHHEGHGPDQLFGYGGGFSDEKSLASNAISFNVTDNGLATIIN